MPPLDALDRGARDILDRPLTGPERASFSKYLDLLLKWQRTHRLVGSADPAWIVEHLFLDSLLFLRVLPRAFDSLLDIGSGAGVPGIPLKIVRPHVRLTLIESRRRRASFLSSVARDLALMDVEVLNARAEALTDERAQSADAVVLRCAGNLNELLSVAARFVSPGGIIAAAGPPTPTPLAVGIWRQVPGLKPGAVRRFAVMST